jgi:hypothetical protein
MGTGVGSITKSLDQQESSSTKINEGKFILLPYTDNVFLLFITEMTILPPTILYLTRISPIYPYITYMLPKEAIHKSKYLLPAPS